MAGFSQHEPRNEASAIGLPEGPSPCPSMPDTGPMRSQNGWPVLSVEDTRLWSVPETGRILRAAPGAAGFVLVHLAHWFHERVEPIDLGTLDDWGYAYRPIRGSLSVF